MSLVWTEGDTTIFTICNKIRENGRRETIVIDAGDTDIYVQTACVSQKVSGEILTKKNNIYVDNQTLFTTCNGLFTYMIWLVVITNVVSMGLKKTTTKTNK